MELSLCWASMIGKASGALGALLGLAVVGRGAVGWQFDVRRRVDIASIRAVVTSAVTAGRDARGGSASRAKGVIDDLDLVSWSSHTWRQRKGKGRCQREW